MGRNSPLGGPEDSSPSSSPSRFRIPPFCLRWALPLRSRLAIGQKARESARTPLALARSVAGSVGPYRWVGAPSGGRGWRSDGRGGEGGKPAGRGSAGGGAPAALILLGDPLPSDRTAAGAAAAPCRRQPPLPAAAGANAAGAATHRLVSAAGERGRPLLGPPGEAAWPL